MGQNTPSNLQIVGMESDRGQDNSREKTIAARHGSHFAETHSFRRDAHLAEIVMPSQTVTDIRGSTCPNCTTCPSSPELLTSSPVAT